MVQENILDMHIKQRSARSTVLQRVLKRAMDVILASVALVLLSPLLALIGFIVKVTSHGAMFYRWEVIGKDGRPFVGYKFRTMVPDADDLKHQLLYKNEMNGPVFKMQNDPRVTSVGLVLRKFSLDELPQLWSVLKGDMSLVGPRPVFPHEWKHFEDWQRRKLSVIPGSLCLWHIRGKPQDFDQWIRLELEYIDSWSLWVDTKVLIGGVWYIVAGKNC